MLSRPLFSGGCVGGGALVAWAKMATGIRGGAKVRQPWEREEGAEEADTEEEGN